MTKNALRCPNYLAIQKFNDWFHDRNNKQVDKVSFDEQKKWDRVWKAYNNKLDKAIKSFVRRNKIKNCGYHGQLVRIYFKKVVRKESKKYQGTFPFGWFCPGCKEIFLEKDLEKKGLGSFHSTYTW